MNYMVACSGEQSASSCTDTSAMMWSTKTIDCSPKELMKVYLIIVMSNLLPFLYCAWLMWDTLAEDIDVLIGLACIGVAYATYLIMLVARQKTIFNYHIKTQSGSVEYFLHYPDFAGPFFKGIAIFTILLFLGVALVTGSLLFLIGPAAISLGAARTLLNWKNPIHHRETRPWDMHNFVTLDRKRSIIVIHCTDITTGFVAHLPNKELFEQYLQFLHSVLPPTAEYMEKDWEW
ncbi:permease [Pseudomonas lijiangensis]|uniref:Permease n=1 Tax=Pseudomonas lijiangensis TaxID=2995658 RepID=A0ABX8HTI9_9PSED|nr:permease [Pseudomonas lijiangensis]QWU82751.1 permease [Pseudomonas lijiangensis]